LTAPETVSKHKKTNETFGLMHLRLDWSCYCALTYPLARVEHLASSYSAVQTKRTQKDLPANYTVLYCNGFDSASPFRENTFDIVILRFPTISPDAKLWFSINECMWVLRPEGFLEITCLDLDLLRTSPYTRRALRKSKTQIIKANQDISSRSGYNTVQSILGYRGFGNIHRVL